MNSITFIFFLSFVYNACAKLHIYELSHSYSNETIYWPSGDPEDVFKIVKEVRTDLYEANRFCTPEHGGTHTDAPTHFAPGKHGVHDIPLERIIGKAFFVDVSEEAKTNADLLITQKHIEDAEKQVGRSVDDHILMLYTGWSQKYPNRTQYLGSNTNNASLLHFPGLHPDAATWLVGNRKVKSIGIDTPSIDYGQSKDFQSHVILFKENIPAFENVNLKGISEYKNKPNLMIYGLPMKIKNGSGAPTRIVATYDDSAHSNGSLTVMNMYLVALMVFVANWL